MERENEMKIVILNVDPFLLLHFDRLLIYLKYLKYFFLKNFLFLFFFFIFKLK